MDYLDWGVFRALGIDGGIRVRSEASEDVTATVRQSFTGGPKAFDKMVNNAGLELNRQVLDGPPPDEELEFRRLGYNPEAILELYDREATYEAEWARLLDKTRNGGVAA